MRLWVLLYTFGYQEWYKPKQRNPYLEITLKLKTLGYSKDKSKVAIGAEIKASNISNKVIRVATGYLEVWADKVRFKEKEPSTFPKDVELALKERLGMAGAYFQPKYSEVIFISKLFSDTILNAGESAEANKILYIPVGIFDQLEGNVYLLTGPIHEIDKLNIILEKKNDYIRWGIVEIQNGKQVQYWQDSDKFKQTIEGKQIYKSRTNDVLSLW